MRGGASIRTEQLLSDFCVAAPQHFVGGASWRWAEPLSEMARRAGRGAGISGVLRRGSVVVSVSIVALLFTSSPPMLSLALLALWAVVEYAALRYQVAARYREFDRDFPVLLTAMSSAVRTGVDLRGAIKGSQQYFPPDSVIASELRKLVQGWDRGEDDETAFASFGRSVDHPDVPLFLAAARLALSHGTSFAETLHRLAKVCRQRQSFRRKVRAALAMQRMSSVGILLCALCIAGFQLLTGRAAVVAAYHHPTGRIFLALGVGLIFSGVLWMSRIGLRKV